MKKIWKYVKMVFWIFVDYAIVPICVFAGAMLLSAAILGRFIVGEKSRKLASFAVGMISAALMMRTMHVADEADIDYLEDDE